MKTDMLRRLEALERRGSTRSSGDPHRLYNEVASLGLEVPELHPGESKQEWLSRVPTATLEALLERGEAKALSRLPNTMRRSDAKAV